MSIYKVINYNISSVNANIIQNKNNFWVKVENFMCYRGIIAQSIKSSSFIQIALTLIPALLFSVFYLFACFLFL